MVNYKMLVSYDGTKYNGWQKQGNTKNTIQGKIEEILSRLLDEEIVVIAAGRTDAGVHAFGQVVNFHTEKVMDVEQLKIDMNQYLPLDIRIQSICFIDNRFHARLNAIGKHYSYRIDNSLVSDIFSRKYEARIEEELDLEAMKKASRNFIGTHDFASFCSNRKMKKSTVRTVEKIDLINRNGIIFIEVYGNGFLYNMVRIIVGTLIEVGLHKKAPSEIIELLEKKDRSYAGNMAPAKGLFLVEVFYDTSGMMK